MVWDNTACRGFSYHGYSILGLVAYPFGVVVLALVVPRAVKYETKVRSLDQGVTDFI